MASPIGSGGTRDTKVQRIEEGAAALATVSNPNASPITMTTFDTGTAGVRGPAAIGQRGDERPRPSATIDTQWEYNGLNQSDSLTRGQGGVW